MQWYLFNTCVVHKFKIEGWVKNLGLVYKAKRKGDVIEAPVYCDEFTPSNQSEAQDKTLSPNLLIVGVGKLTHKLWDRHLLQFCLILYVYA